MADIKMFSFEAMISRTSNQMDLFQFVERVLRKVHCEVEFRDAIRLAITKMVSMRAVIPKWFPRFQAYYRRINHHFRDVTSYISDLKHIYQRFFWVKEFSLDEFQDFQHWIVFYLNRVIPYHFLKRITASYFQAIHNHDESARKKYNSELAKINFNLPETMLDEDFQVVRPVTIYNFLPELTKKIKPVVQSDFQLPLALWDSKFAHLNHLGQWRVYNNEETDDE